MPLSPELEAYIPRFVQIESGGNPNARTGSYSGLLQMGPAEAAQYGGNGLEQGKQLLADRAAQFEAQYGRQPTPTELYLGHQQGMGGLAAHMANPDLPAWQNMASTGEGRQKGAAWAKQAIWGNVPTDVRAQFPGGVDSLTSQQFMDLWRSKVERTPMQTAFAPSASAPSASPSAPSGLLASPEGPGLFAARNAEPDPGGGLLNMTPQLAQLQPPQIPFAPRRRIDLSRLQAMRHA